MFIVSEEQFKSIVSEAIDSIPPKYGKHIKNLAFIVEDNPSQDQRVRLNLGPSQSLYGLYEGVPMTKRGNYNMALPDKITIFKRPIEFSANNIEELVDQVRKTLWHEVAHYFGLDHLDIHNLEDKGKAQSER